MKFEFSFELSPVVHYLLVTRELPLTFFAGLIAVCSAPQLWDKSPYRLILCNIPFYFAGSVMTAASWTAGANSMMPFYTILTVMAGFALTAIPDNLRSQAALYYLMALLLVFQFDFRMPYNISKSLGRLDRDFTDLVGFLKEQDGSMYCPSDNVITLLAGRHNYEDIFLAWEIDISRPDHVDRVKKKINACDVDWLIMHNTGVPPGTMSEETVQAYEKKGDYGDWEVFRKRL